MSTDLWKAAYWQVVADCLVAFHGRQPGHARNLASFMRARIEVAPADVDPEMVYHAEAFDVAARIAGIDLDLSYHRDVYEKIWHKRFASVSEETVTVARPRIHPREARA